MCEYIYTWKCVFLQEIGQDYKVANLLELWIKCLTTTVPILCVLSTNPAMVNSAFHPFRTDKEVPMQVGGLAKMLDWRILLCLCLICCRTCSKRIEKKLYKFANKSEWSNVLSFYFSMTCYSHWNTTVCLK